MKGLIFTYLMTGGGVVLSLFNPFYGLLAYVCFAIVKPEAMWPWSVPSGRYSLMLALAMLVGWTYSKRATFQFGRSGAIVNLLLLFLAWASGLALFAPNQEVAWKFVEDIAKIAIPFYVGLTTITSLKQLQQLAWTIMVSQGYVAFEMNVAYLRGNNILATDGIGALDNNGAANAMVTGLGLAFFLGLHAPYLWQKGLALGLGACLGHAILFSFSRGGMLAMLCTGVATFLIIPKRPRHYFAFALAAVMGLYLAGAEVRERFESSFAGQGQEREESAQSRLDLWRDCWDVIQKYPVTGCGPNHWPLLAASYGWLPGKEAHSLWVQTATELGIPGFALLTGFYLVCIARCWTLTRQRTEMDDPWYRELARMVIVSLTGFAVAAQFVSVETLEIPYYVVLLGAGTLKLSGAGFQPAHAFSNLSEVPDALEHKLESVAGQVENLPHELATQLA